MKPGCEHRRVARDLDAIEPIRDGPLRRVGLLPLSPLPLGCPLQPLESAPFGHEGTGLAGPEIDRSDAASLPFRLVEVSTAVDHFPPHFTLRSLSLPAPDRSKIREPIYRGGAAPGRTSFIVARWNRISPAS